MLLGAIPWDRVPVTDLADAATVRRWVMRQGRNISAAALRRFRAKTGQGISREALAEIMADKRVRLTLDDFEVLPTPMPTDASVRAETHVHLEDLLASAATADDLGAFVREFNQHRSLVNLPRLIPAWEGAIARLHGQAETANSVAGGCASDVDVSGMTFEQAIATRDRETIGRWGQYVTEATRFARLDVLQARGLEHAVDDALVRTAHLV